MSYSDYLWELALTLRTRIHPQVAGEETREVIQNSVRVLTALANALERDPGGAQPIPGVQAKQLPPSTVRDARGPPENAALYLSTQATIADVAARIEGGGSIDLPGVREIIAWERKLLDTAIGRMEAVETANAMAGADARLQIDPVRVQQYLRRRTGSADLLVDGLRLAVGGRSRQTALFSVRGAAGVVPAKLVLQRAIPGMAKTDAFSGPAAEYQLLESLYRAGLKVPRPLFLETDPEPLGAPFVVVEQAPGKVVQPDYWQVPQSPAMAQQLAEQMALLHALPYEALAPLLPRSRARSDRQGFVDELDGLEASWHAQSHGPSVTMSAALAWLRANVDCVEDRRSLVHNDLVFHNIMAEGDRITAVLDWEQTSIGHPAEDLGYCYPVVAAMMDWDRFVMLYRQAGGPLIEQREIDFFSLRALVRLMILVQLGSDAFEQGKARDILVAAAGAFFAQRLMRRLAGVLQAVLAHQH